MSRRCPTCRKVKYNNQFPQKYSKTKRRKLASGSCHACRYVMKNTRGDALERFLKKLWVNARNRCRNSDKAFTLTLEHLTKLYTQQGGKCALTGIQLTHTLGEGNVGTNASLDRIDSGGGYVKNNVWLVCRDVNVFKGTQSMPELLKTCRLILETHGDKSWTEKRKEPSPKNPRGSKAGAA